MERYLALITVAISFWLAGCDESVRSEYATRGDAAADRLFERGWLPEIIPPSSRDIVSISDLDLNTSKGEFRFDRADLPSFVEHLVRDPANDINRFRAFRYREWSFQLHEQEGFCTYDFAIGDASHTTTMANESW